MNYLEQKFTKRKVKNIRDDLKTKQYRTKYLITDKIDGFGRVLFTLNNRNNLLRPAKIYQRDGQVTLHKVDQIEALNVHIIEINNAKIIARSDGFIKNDDPVTDSV